MEWIFGIFAIVMLTLLVYSIIATSLALRKKIQPSVDLVFEALHFFVFRRQRSSGTGKAVDSNTK